MHSNPMAAPATVDASRKSPAGSVGKKSRRESLTSRELLAMEQGRMKHLPAALPQHKDVKLKMTTKEKKKLYRRGSVVDRYRRASVFNEIVAENLRADVTHASAQSGGSHKPGQSRINAIQKTQNYGVGTANRSRLVAFEQLAHAEGVADGGFVINPFCVASLDESIRVAFVRKVFGIVLSQMLLMLVTICIIKYAPGVGDALVQSYYYVSLISCFLPILLLCVLFAVRQSHPYNLVVFSLFTLSWAYSLGVISVFLQNHLFVVVTAGVAVNTLIIMLFSMCVSYERFNCCNCTIMCILITAGAITTSALAFPGEAAGAHVLPGIVCLFFSAWMCWDIKAIQIDLTPDEYIIGAVDIYLDILNMFLWILVCCLHCFESFAK